MLQQKICRKFNGQRNVNARFDFHVCFLFGLHRSGGRISATVATAGGVVNLLPSCVTQVTTAGTAPIQYVTVKNFGIIDYMSSAISLQTSAQIRVRPQHNAALHDIDTTRHDTTAQNETKRKKQNERTVFCRMKLVVCSTLLWQAVVTCS